MPSKSKGGLSPKDPLPSNQPSAGDDRRYRGYEEQNSGSNYNYEMDYDVDENETDPRGGEQKDYEQTSSANKK